MCGHYSFHGMANDIWNIYTWISKWCVIWFSWYSPFLLQEHVLDFEHSCLIYDWQWSNLRWLNKRVCPLSFPRDRINIYIYIYIAKMDNFGLKIIIIPLKQVVLDIWFLTLSRQSWLKQNHTTTKSSFHR